MQNDITRPRQALSTGENICGTVTDASGAIVSSAPVNVLDVDTGMKHSGTHIFEELPLGKYSLTVLAPGLAPTDCRNRRVRRSDLRRTH